MPFYFTKEDKRILKTHKLLNMAMLSLLKKNNFKYITVGNICNEALIGRATFYTHFTDKYDLLKFWLLFLWQHEMNNGDPQKDDVDVEKSVNQFIRENETIIINLLDNADDKTLDVLFDFLYSVLEITNEQYIDGKINQKYVVASNFYVGGIVSYLLWQVKNNFPQDVPVINEHFLGAFRKLREWELEISTTRPTGGLL